MKPENACTLYNIYMNLHDQRQHQKAIFEGVSSLKKHTPDIQLLRKTILYQAWSRKTTSKWKPCIICAV